MTRVELLAQTPPTTFRNRVDKTHSTVSNGITSVAKRIDRFLGNQKAFDEANTTRLQVYSAITYHEDGEITRDTNTRLKLVLPNTEKRMRLVVENISDRNQESTSSLTSGSSRAIAGNYQEGESTSAFVRYISRVAGIKVTFDVGLRLESSLKPLANLRFSKVIPLSDWYFLPLEQITWIGGDGFSSTTGLDFERRLSEKWFFRFTNAIEWTELDQNFHFINGPSWYQRISEKQAMTYNMRVESALDGSYTINNTVFSISFRQLLYENWLFLSVIPAVSYPEEEDYRASRAITLKIDAVFGNLDQAVNDFFSNF